MINKIEQNLITNDTDYCEGKCQTDSSFCGMFGCCKATHDFLEPATTEGMVW